MIRFLILAILTRTNLALLHIGPLLSSCIDAAQRGCDQIRAVQALRDDNIKNSDKDGDSLLLQVQLKDAKDARSALTIADRAAQQAIVDSLRALWGDASPQIIGEEDDDNDNPDDESFRQDDQDLLFVKYTQPLNTHFLDDDLGSYDTPELDPSRVTIFVDPLDGTREFVEGRLANCQVLVGIAIDGEAVAGAIGLPFPDGDLSTDATVVYGLQDVGTGFRGTPLKRGPYPLDCYIDGIKYPRPHIATGDNPDQVVQAACEAVTKTFGGSRVVYGGAGNKILAAALGEVACCIQHKFGGPWDLCAPHAIAKAMGATVTDLFGQEIAVYNHPSTLPPRCNERGYVASSPGSDHAALIQTIQNSPVVQEYRNCIMEKSTAV